MQELKIINDESQFPNLLFLSDVPVEASYHGSALIYRLLQNWPAKKLRIIEGNLYRSQPERRLPDIKYAVVDIGRKRLLSTRFSQWYSIFLLKQAPKLVEAVKLVLGNFVPQAIVTVTHGYLWLTAASYAKECNIPLHLICHDHWPYKGTLPRQISDWQCRQFCNTYELASKRFCVSPGMVEVYKKRCGCVGDVLYPSRAANCPIYQQPPSRLSIQPPVFTIAYAGTLNTSDYFRSLQTLASALKNINGRLLIFGPVTSAELAHKGLNLSNVSLEGMLLSNELIGRFRNEVDALFLPMSFDPEERIAMETLFPSKLTDYTAAGLPLIIYGPSYCSAVKWASENPGIGEIVTINDEEQLFASVRRLADQPSIRMASGGRVIDAGNRYFSYADAERIFCTAVKESILS